MNVPETAAVLVVFQDGGLTVSQDPLTPGPPLLRFHYQLNERRSAFWDTALSEDALFLEIPAGPLVEGSKEGYVLQSSRGLTCSPL